MSWNDDELMEERSFRTSGDEDNEELDPLPLEDEFGFDEEEVEKDG